ncbi:hypothetical protein L204_101396 [Cryptococcus depauperatus]
MKLVKMSSSMTLGSHSSTSPSVNTSWTEPATETDVARPTSPTRPGLSRKRRSKFGEKKYPPSSYTPGNGWTFGRMRSFKGDIMAREATSGSEGEADTIVDGVKDAVANDPLLSQVYSLPPVTPSDSWDKPMASPSELVEPLPTKSRIGLAVSTDELPGTASRLQTTLAAQVILQGSNYPPNSQVMMSPLSRRSSHKEAAPNKLTKKRPMLATQDKCHPVDPANADGAAANPYISYEASSRSSQIHDFSTDPSPIPPILPLPSLSPLCRTLPLPEGAAPPEHVASDMYYFLNRNASTATSHASSSSAAGPSTEESLMLITPSDHHIAFVPYKEIGAVSEGVQFGMPVEGINQVTSNEMVHLVNEEVVQDNAVYPLRDLSLGRQGYRRSSQGSPTASKGSSSDTVALNGSTMALRVKTEFSPKLHKEISSDKFKSPDSLTPLSQHTPPDLSLLHIGDSAAERLHSPSFSASIATDSAYSVGDFVSATPFVLSQAHAIVLSPTEDASGSRRMEEGKGVHKRSAVSDQLSQMSENFCPQIPNPDSSLIINPTKRSALSVKDGLLSPPSTSHHTREYHSRPAPPPPHLPHIMHHYSKSRHLSISPTLERPDVQTLVLASKESLGTPMSQSITVPPPSQPVSPGKPTPLPIERSTSFGKMLRKLSMGRGSGKKKKKGKGKKTCTEDEGFANEGICGSGDTSDFGFGISYFKDLKSASLGSPLTRRATKLMTASPETFTPHSVEQKIKGGTTLSPTRSQPLRDRIKSEHGTSAKRSNTMPAQTRAPPFAPYASTVTSAGLLMVGPNSESTSISPSASTSTRTSNIDIPGSRSTTNSPFVEEAYTQPKEGTAYSGTESDNGPELSDSLPTWSTLLGPYTPPELLSLPSYFKLPRTYSPSAPSSPRDQSHLLSLDEHKHHSHEVRRRFRQSLVHIKDDRQFAYMLEEFARIESDPRARMALGGGISLASMAKSPEEDGDREIDTEEGRVLMKSKQRDIIGTKAKQQSIAAWFVTREIVQGEGRHARLLARGLRIARTAAGKSKDRDFTSTSPVPFFSKTAPSSASEQPEISFSTSQPKSHNRTGSVPSILRKRRSSLSDQRPQQSQQPAANLLVDSATRSLFPNRRVSTFSLSYTSLTPSKTSTLALTAIPPSTSALTTLLVRLPALLDISLNLSSAFSHDVSPFGVAQAFIQMEETLTREVALWAGEVGGVIVSGITETLNKLMENEKKKKRKNETLQMHEEEEEEGDERVAYLDIILMPIQRASRYKLLFQELSTKIPPASTTHHKILAAIEASQRLAVQCDACQLLDLELLRRQERKTKKVRPVSAGASHKSMALWGTAVEYN